MSSELSADGIAQRLGWPELKAAVESRVTSLLLNPEPGSGNGLEEQVTTAALVPELLAEGTRRERDELAEEVGLLNDLGDSVTALSGLLRGKATLAHLSDAELASSLYSMAGYSSKAASVWLRFIGTVEAIADPKRDTSGGESALQWTARDVLGRLSTRDFRGLRNLSGALMSMAESRGLSRDHARFSYTLASFCDRIDHVARAGPTPEDLTAIRATLRLLDLLAIQARDGELLTLARRISTSTHPFLQSGTAIVLDSLKLPVSSEYRMALTGRGSPHPIFELWPPQTQALRDGFLRPGSWVVSLPTSAGKTLLAEMKIATLLTRAPDSLVVYVAPYTALATQVAERLEPRLRAANLAEPLIWTGSYEIDPEVQTLGNLLVMTPEKLDSVLRTSLEDDPRSHDLISRLQLVVLDECHALGVGERGLTYELLIARLLRRFPDSEICAMSAVLGNPQALSQWLTGVARSVSVSSWRPTGARLLVYRRDGWVTDHARRNLIRLPGWSSPKNAAAAIAERLVQAGEWPVLILETQRGYAESAAAEAYSRLANLDLPRMSVDRNRSATRAEQELGQDANLGDMIRAGVAFHHAGIPFGLRREIEGLVRNRQLRVLCSTTTLAEGVDLPFRSIICPHLYFEGTPMSRPLFQNIAGRAGRAFVSTEGTVIFLEPGRSEGLQYLYERLLPKDAGPIEAESRLSDVLRSPRRPWEWRLQWCFQAQILGLLGDEQLEAEEISAFIQRTFQYARQPTSATVRPLRRKLERLLEDMESSDPPFAEAASPIRLTAWGRAACLTGLSLDSVRILRRELLRLHDESGSWYEDESWAQRSAPEGLLKEIVWLSLSALESFSRSLRMPPRYGAFGDALRSWIEGDYRVFEDLTAMDWPLLREWLRGTDTRRLADENMMGIRRSTPARQLLELNRYYEARASLLPWMYSAVLRVAKYLEDEEQVAVPDRVGFGVNFLRWGVDSLAGAFLAAELRLPRVAASRLAGSLDFDVESLEDSLMDELASLDQGALEEVIGDRWLAEQTGITLSAIQEP